MTNFENFKFKNIDELVDWLDEYGDFDNAPWNKWWDKNYCSKCEPITSGSGYGYEYAPCEFSNKCVFFENMNEIPDHKQVIKMWLELESDVPNSLFHTQMVDTVEVIRCKDCKKSDNDAYPVGRVWCHKMCRYMKEDGFCSEGE